MKSKIPCNNPVYSSKYLVLSVFQYLKLEMSSISKLAGLVGRQFDYSIFEILAS